MNNFFVQAKQSDNNDYERTGPTKIEGKNEKRKFPKKRKQQLEYDEAGSLTNWYVGTCHKVAVVTTPASHGSMPEHIGLGPIGGRFRADNFRARPIADVNVSDIPGNGSFLHRRSRLRLNDRESVNSASETV